MSTSRLFSTKEAASYLGIKEETIKYHVYISRALHPEKVGGTLVFTQEELDRFTIDKRPAHRPKSSR